MAGTNAAAAATGSTNTDHSLIITSLSGLDGVTPEAYTTTFMSNLDIILNHPQEEILAKLGEKDASFDNTRKELRQHLLTEVGKRLADYANKTAIDRRSQDKICEDIYLLAFSFHHTKPHKDLNNVYTKTPVAPQMRVDDVASIILAVTQVQQKQETLEKNSAEKDKVINQLTQKVNSLEKELEDIKSGRIQTRAPNSTTSPEAEPLESEIDNNISDPELVANGLISDERNQPEETEHHAPTTQLITPAKKQADIFIGGVNTSHSCSDIKKFMNTGTTFQLELKDIKEHPVKGDVKAFKVTLPAEKAQEAISIWPSGIKAAIYESKATYQNSPTQKTRFKTQQIK